MHRRQDHTNRGIISHIVARSSLNWRLQLVWLCLLVRPTYATEPIEKGPIGLVWEAAAPEETTYAAEIDRLLQVFEEAVGEELRPGEAGRVGLKINTRSGPGLSTPKPLVRALAAELEERGFARSNIILVDSSTNALRAAGYLQGSARDPKAFEGMPVIALDDPSAIDAEWFYDSPLPPSYAQRSNRSIFQFENAGERARKSFLPAPLLFDVDFWINLPVPVDDPVLGVDAALANATLWNVTNSQRFLVNDATASAAVAEIAAIPELEEKMIFTIVSMNQVQFIAGPMFNSLYTRSEGKLWLSSDPVALDRLILDAFNKLRVLEGFAEIDPEPQQLIFAASLGLGVSNPDAITIEQVETVAPVLRPLSITRTTGKPAPETPPAKPQESFWRRVTPW